MDFHEVANIFPLMEGVEFESLVSDIKVNGLIEPIWVYEGKIIDGRNRYKACQKLDIAPEYKDYEGDNALSFVISLNLKRRHLNESQRAVVASRLANMKHGGDRKSDQVANLPLDISQHEAAEMLNVSERMIRTVKTIERDAPELMPEIESGKITAHQAERKVKSNEREQVRYQLAQKGLDVKQSERWNIYHGDMKTIELNKQYDFIITDPPYPKEYLPLWEALAIRSKELLSPGGLLIAMSGQLYLNQIYEILDRHLSYYWTACYLTLHQPTPLRTRNVNTTWKPILIYSLGGKYVGKIFGDVYQSPQPEKTNHDWEQSIDGMYALIKQICLPGQSILDPFCGSGTTGKAALQHGCFFDGIDLDIENVKISRARLDDTKT